VQLTVLRMRRCEVVCSSVTTDWFRTRVVAGELVPVRVFTLLRKSRDHAAEGGDVYAGVYASNAEQLYELTFANLPQHQRMEAGPRVVLELMGTDAAERADCDGDEVEGFNGGEAFC